MADHRITEQDSLYDHIESMSTHELLVTINKEDQKVARAVQLALDQVENLVEAINLRMKEGGRLFYIGSGTSGRLGIVDASECPPTFGVSPDLVIGIIAGGDGAIRQAVEFAEDDPEQAWKDIQYYLPGKLDSVIGIAASGTTPYVIGGLRTARREGLLTGCVTCNPGSPVTQEVEFPVAVEVGPEFITGSTRMKSGTAQKMVLNMISTCLMVKMGRVKGNKMVDMQLTNQKLVNRGIEMLKKYLGVDDPTAKELLLRYGSVRKALEKDGD